MAKIILTIEDGEGEDIVHIRGDADPPISLAEGGENTAAQILALKFLDLATTEAEVLHASANEGAMND